MGFQMEKIDLSAIINEAYSEMKIVLHEKQQELKMMGAIFQISFLLTMKA